MILGLASYLREWRQIHATGTNGSADATGTNGSSDATTTNGSSDATALTVVLTRYLVISVDLRLTERILKRILRTWIVRLQSGLIRSRTGWNK
jgi:hypothetical protein